MNTINKLLLVSFMACLVVFGMQILFTGIANAQYTCSIDTDCGNNRYVDQQFCQGNSLYQNYVRNTCSNPGTSNSSCFQTKSPQLIQVCPERCEENLWYIGCSTGSTSNNTNNTNNNGSCTSHAYKKCANSGVYWFNSCGNQQELYQACNSNQVCSENSCVLANNTTNYYNPYGNTTYNPYGNSNYNARATKGCIYNVSYWYDSYGNRGEVYKNCGASGMYCQNGGCYGQTTTTTTTTQTTNTNTQNNTQNTNSGSVIKHFRIVCYNGGVYWYDSAGKIQDIYADCSDNNSCTIDICNDSKCQNDLKCDGSTCASSSLDYAKYCSKTGAKDNSEFTASLTGNPFINFFKNWYGWIMAIIVLIFLFVLIFRRLSSNS